MTSHPASAPTTSEPERLHSIEDEDFDRWLEEIPATDTASLLVEYRKYASAACAKDEEFLTFEEWRRHLGDHP